MDSSSTTADNLFEGLCLSLDLEIKRQEAVLEACRAQGAAARARDVERLDANTGTLWKLITEAGKAEKKRALIASKVAEHYGLDPSRDRLSHLIEVAPEHCRERVLASQWRLRRIVNEVRAVIAANAALLRASLKIVHEILHEYETRMAGVTIGYTADGVSPATAGAAPRLLNQKG